MKMCLRHNFWLIGEEPGPEQNCPRFGTSFPKLCVLRTPEEKAGPKARKRKRGHAKHLKPEVVHRPLTAFLRTANVLGGSFSLTTTGQMPVYVFDYVTRKLNALAP